MPDWGSALYWIFHMPCLFHLLTGLYCPGCGGTRAVKYLLQGQWALSFRCHPLVLYGVGALALELVSVLAGRVLGKPLVRPGKEISLVYGGVVLVVVNWIVKNGALLVLGVDLLTQPL